MRLAAKMLFPGSGWLFRLHCVVAESRQPDADFFFSNLKSCQAVAVAMAGKVMKVEVQ